MTESVAVENSVAPMAVMAVAKISGLTARGSAQAVRLSACDGKEQERERERERERDGRQNTTTRWSPCTGDYVPRRGPQPP